MVSILCIYELAVVAIKGVTMVTQGCDNYLESYV